MAGYKERLRAVGDTFDEAEHEAAEGIRGILQDATEEGIRQGIFTEIQQTLAEHLGVPLSHLQKLDIFLVHHMVKRYRDPGDWYDKPNVTLRGDGRLFSLRYNSIRPTSTYEGEFPWDDVLRMNRELYDSEYLWEGGWFIRRIEEFLALKRTDEESQDQVSGPEKQGQPTLYERAKLAEKQGKAMFGKWYKENWGELLQLSRIATAKIIQDVGGSRGLTLDEAVRFRIGLQRRTNQLERGIKSLGGLYSDRVKRELEALQFDGVLEKLYGRFRVTSLGREKLAEYRDELIAWTGLESFSSLQEAEEAVHKEPLI